jgi:hypothetical protein
MCDFRDGEVLLSVPRFEPYENLVQLWFEHHGEEFGLRILDRMDSLLASRGVPREMQLESPVNLWRLAVPRGQEVYVASRMRIELQSSAIRASGNDELAARLVADTVAEPNGICSTAGSAAASGPPLFGDVSLTAVHADYKAMIGCSPGEVFGAEPVTVAVVDSGISPALMGRLDHYSDFVDGSQTVVEDKIMHGTVVSSVIADLAPSARFQVFRVADSSGLVTEWELVAALLSMGLCQVVNLSLTFSLDRPDCITCGRRANESRKITLESALNLLLDRPDPPIVIAAAGNAAREEVFYPAKYGRLVAVGSVNSRGELSSFSNWSSVDEAGQPHPCFWYLPGGDEGFGQLEEVASVPGSALRFVGTSYSCAYATGLVADLLSALPADRVRAGLRAGQGRPVGASAGAVAGRGVLTRGTVVDAGSTLIW